MGVILTVTGSVLVDTFMSFNFSFDSNVSTTSQSSESKLFNRIHLERYQ